MRVEIESFAAFLQQIVRLVGAGYVLWSATARPESKRDRNKAIDQKLLVRYPLLSATKYQRAYRKRTGRLNAYLLRHGHQQLILATEGADDVGLLAKEHFQDARRRSLVVRHPALGVDLRVHLCDGHWTVSLTKAARHQLQAFATELGRKADLGMAVAEWRRLDDQLPGWRGLIQDKLQIRKCLIHQAKVAGKRWSFDQFSITTYRRMRFDGGFARARARH